MDGCPFAAALGGPVPNLSSAEAIPFVASATTIPKVLPGQLCPVVLSWIGFDELNDFALLLYYNLALCEHHP